MSGNSSAGIVGVIGLGAMGAAIARAIDAAGIDLVVWNRGPARLEPFRAAGIDCAASVAELVANVDTLLVCIHGYAATRELLSAPGVAERLAGRTLIQVSTGTPQEAREAEEWANEAGLHYLDGAILAYPEEVGASALIAVGGAQSAFESRRPVFDALTDDLRYLGDSAAAAAALDLAVLSFYVCTHLGLVHGALISEAEGLDRTVFANVIADSAASDSDEIRKLGAALERGEFSDPGASIEVYSGVLDRILRHAGHAGINSEIPAFVDSIYKRGMAAGLADEEVVALVKVLGGRGRS